MELLKSGDVTRRQDGKSLWSTVRTAATILSCACLLMFLTSHVGHAQSRDKNPLEPGRVIDDIAPTPGAVFPIGVPDSWFDFKDRVYEDIGLKFGFSYQMLGQWASDTLPGAEHDTALGEWYGFMLKWTLLNRGADNEGHLVFSMFQRNAVGDNALPATFGSTQVGSLTSNVGFTSWDFAVENLYWEQWLSPGNDDLMLRFGNQVVTTLLNPSRFKDERVSFTTGPWTFHESMPYPTFGFGAGFKWWPDGQQNDGLYFAGSVNDMNGDPNVQGLDWSTVDKDELFYGAEVGYTWERSEDDYDHVHLTFFYADKRSTRSPDTLPNEPGGGFRVYGEKQWDNWVGFGGYTYNTAEGGGVGGTVAKHTLTGGVSYLKPFGFDGEATVSLLYMDPIEDIFDQPVRDQYGLEAYWRIRLTNNIWLTPGISLIFDPATNPNEDFIAVPSIKFRVAI